MWYLTVMPETLNLDPIIVCNMHWWSSMRHGWLVIVEKGRRAGSKDSLSNGHDVRVSRVVQLSGGRVHGVVMDHPLSSKPRQGV